MSKQLTFERAKETPRQEKTYGEKKHHFIFNILINFWATLAISGAFVFWFKHSTTKLPQRFFGGQLPRDFHQWFRKQFTKSWMVKIFPESKRAEVGNIMADALSINLPGLTTILPSAWLGAKFKTPIVKWFDRRHYGEDAENDPHIAQRHAAIAAEVKPTFFGALLARLASMGASVFTGYAIGMKENFANRWGKYGHVFPGIDQLASNAGEVVGNGIHRGAPPVGRAVDVASRKMQIDWTKGEQTYGNALQGWMKYTSLDIMYTTVTATTIHPFLKLVSYLPFTTYKQTPERASPKEKTAALKQHEISMLPVGRAKTIPVPHTQVSDIAARETIKPPELETARNA